MAPLSPCTEGTSLLASPPYGTLDHGVSALESRTFAILTAYTRSRSRNRLKPWITSLELDQIEAATAFRPRWPLTTIMAVMVLRKQEMSPSAL